MEILIREKIWAGGQGQGKDRIFKINFFSHYCRALDHLTTIFYLLYHIEQIRMIHEGERNCGSRIQTQYLSLGCLAKETTVRTAMEFLTRDKGSYWPLWQVRLNAIKEKMS